MQAQLRNLVLATLLLPIGVGFIEGTSDLVNRLPRSFTGSDRVWQNMATLLLGDICGCQETWLDQYSTCFGCCATYYIAVACAAAVLIATHKVRFVLLGVATIVSIPIHDAYVDVRAFAMYSLVLDSQHRLALACVSATGVFISVVFLAVVELSFFLVQKFGRRDGEGKHGLGQSLAKVFLMCYLAISIYGWFIL